jgi:SET domain-containing protein
LANFFLIPVSTSFLQAARHFKKGEFVLEYAGLLISRNTALERESQYSKDLTIGSFLYYFQHGGKELW